MILNRPRAWIVGALAAIALAGLVERSAVAGGPVSDMISRYKTQRQMKLPPMDKPFVVKPMKDPNHAGLATRFKQRFSMTKPEGTSILSRSLFSSKGDKDVNRTSR